MSNVSDASGRSLEYKIVDKIIQSNIDCTILGNTNSDQKRDKSKFNTLDSNQQLLYTRSAERLFVWLKDNFKIHKSPFSIERLPDSAAIAGDVTDIRLSIKNETINLSIKHNHHAVKHQRPASTLQQCGVIKGATEDISFRNELSNVFNKFLKDANKLKSGASLFKELKEIDEKFIDLNLYEPICDLVAKTIINTCSNEVNTQSLFKFLIGKTNYNKIIVQGDELKIYRFADLKNPSSLKVTRQDKSYIFLEFSNGFKISMRLHTASSRLGTSVKFDSQPINLESSIPVEKIKL